MMDIDDIKIGIAQLNAKSGDIEFNAKNIVKSLNEAKSKKIDLIIFPELFLTGFPLEDTILRHKNIAYNTFNYLKEIANLTDETAVLVGFLELSNDNKYYNSFALLQNAKIKKIFRQTCSSKFSLFNDSKYIQEDYNSCNTFKINGIECLITIGENILENEIKEYNPSIIINCASLTDRRYQKQEHKNKLSLLSKKYQLPLIYVNQIGATDNNFFSGGSVVYSSGEIIAQANNFEEEFLLLNSFNKLGVISQEIKGINRKEFTLDYESELEYTYKVAVIGIRDYFNKNGFQRAVLGLSGGLDSTICAVLLADAIGKKNVLGISMPSKITTNESKSDARVLAENLGINFIEKSIKEIFDVTNSVFTNMFKNLENVWETRYKQSFTQDNIQARVRAMYIWGVCNEFASCLPIATSDKSEIYMGYATINGDMSGGFAPIADIPKTKLFALAKWMNKNRIEKNVIPESVILKRPGAELAIDPKTGKPLMAEDALMPYEFLDEIIWNIENNHYTYEQLLNNKFIYEEMNKVSAEQKVEWINKFYKRISTAIYKWSILPPSIIIEPYSINKCDYIQPITSSGIEYKRMTNIEINKILNESI